MSIKGVDIDTLRREGMKGRNPRRAYVPDDGAILQVHNIFWTVQGEGPFSGHAAMFIRLSGCNLGCTFCDTYWADDNDSFLTLDEIKSEVCRLRPEGSIPLFVITGGEPTRQNITPLVEALKRAWPTCRVQIETAGTFFRLCMTWGFVTTVVSPKLSKVNREVNEHVDAYKYVVKASEAVDIDGVPIADTQGTGTPRPLAKAPPGVPIYVTPCDEQDEVKTAANRRLVVELAQRYGYIAQLQIHKYLEIE